jgi:hypothetical protein
MKLTFSNRKICSCYKSNLREEYKSNLLLLQEYNSYNKLYLLQDSSRQNIVCRADNVSNDSNLQSYI